MLSKSFVVILATALAPIAWGTTYITTTELLPPDRPLLAAVLRALPAGLLLLAITRTLPRGEWWWKSWVLGTLNIGAFFALLFLGAYRLPGGVAATVGAIQPLIVTVLASRLAAERVSARKITAGILGVFGVALLVLQADARLDPFGVAAALGGAASMATGVVLTKRWGQPASALTTTSWQLLAGSITLVPLLLLFEGLPTQPLSLPNLLGYAHLATFGGAIAYVLWFSGIRRLPVSTTAFLGLVTPVVAAVIGWAGIGQTLSTGQLGGMVLVLASILMVVLPGHGSAERLGSDPARRRDREAISEPVEALPTARSRG